MMVGWVCRCWSIKHYGSININGPQQMEAAFGFAEEKERSPRENIFIELLHNRRGGVIEW
jgi:hypothetical protein